MRTTGIEILEYIRESLNARGETIADMCRALNFEPAMFSWWKKKPELSPKVDCLCVIAEYLNVTLNDIVGMKNIETPKDIQKMERMLLEIPEQDREMIELNIKNYYNRSRKN